MRKFFLFVFIFVIFICNLSCKENERVEVKFISCVDGDTANFLVNNKKTKFRFLGIDTPESVKENTPVEPYGKEASEYTCERLTNAKKIVVEYDKNSTKTDKFGRHLAWIWVDDELLQQELLELGYAKVSYVYDDYSYIKNLCFVQSKAKNDKVGLWDNDTDEGYCSKVDYTGSLEVSTYIESEFDDNLSIYIFIFVVILYVMYYLFRKCIKK